MEAALKSGRSAPASGPSATVGGAATLRIGRAAENNLDGHGEFRSSVSVGDSDLGLPDLGRLEPVHVLARSGILLMTQESGDPKIIDGGMHRLLGSGHGNGEFLYQEHLSGRVVVFMVEGRAAPRHAKS